jgi:predicted membrane chloride channel (bestrophin family)
MSTADDLEASQPLLEKDDRKSYGVVPEPDYAKMMEDEDSLPPRIDDPMTYSLAWLKSWRVFYIFKDTVWDNDALWKVMTRLMMLALFVGLLTYNFMPDPTLLDASKFSEITSVLSLFVTLMLSFFLSTSVKRWIECVSGFLELFNSIRNLSMQLHALGVQEQRSQMCLRYGVLSAHFLVHELRCRKLAPDKVPAANSAMWQYLESGPSEYTRLEPGEREILEQLSDRPGQMWVWVGSLIGRMALDGDVPPMPSPTYGRIMNLAQAAQGGLRQVRTSIVVQMPFVYVHTLACLVHLNCLLLAISLGLATGTTTHGIRQYVHHYYYEEHPDPTIHVEPLTAQLQSLIVELLKGFFGPLLFQAFLEIAISVVSPFSDGDAAIPVQRLTKGLETDLRQAAYLATHTPLWETPYFKKPAQEVTSTPLPVAAPPVATAPPAPVVPPPEVPPAEVPQPAEPPSESPAEPLSDQSVAPSAEPPAEPVADQSAAPPAA